MLKKIMATTVALALGLQCMPIYAVGKESQEIMKGVDLYKEEVVENVEIDGIEYIYSYSYNSDGNRVIEIQGENSEQSDMLVYDEDSSNILLNDEILGEVESTYGTCKDDSCSSIERSTGTSSWPHFTSSTNKISWSKGTTVAVVAAAMAAVLGSLGASGVIAAMGSSVLSVLASNAIGGTVYQDIHKFNSNVIFQYKNTWKFTASTGAKYGPYVYTF